MRELLPPGGSEGYGACADEDRPRPVFFFKRKWGADAFPAMGGRSRLPECAAICFPGRFAEILKRKWGTDCLRPCFEKG